MKRLHRDHLQRLAHGGGLARAESCVLSIIGVWSQYEGGKTFEDGKRWQWRSQSEMAQEISYSEATVARAIRSLAASGLIKKRRSWNPSKSGESINFYRLTAAAEALMSLSGDAMHDAQSEPVIAPTSDSSDLTIGSDQDDQSIDTVPSTYGPYTPEEERGAAFAFWKKGFQGENWGDVGTDPEGEFYEGYRKVIRNKLGRTVGAINPKRRQWIAQYLTTFRQEGMPPVFAVAALLVAVWDWENFRIDLVSVQHLPDWKAAREFPEPYDLGVYGHLFVKYLAEECPGDPMLAWWKGS